MANKYAVAGPNSVFSVPGAAPAGFWAGLWHGMIMPVTFFVSLRNPGVRIYETHNTGKRYDLGFLLGASAAFGSSGKRVPPHVDRRHRAPRG
jgi:hypothetical protein